MEKQLPPVPTFRITTYWKRKRGESGLTQMASQRLSLPAALDWVLQEIPDDAWEVEHNGLDVTLTVHWGKVRFRDA